MLKKFDKISEKKFDVAIIGGGIYGLACARDAALRGLSVALFESKDFGGQTSANSAKIAHCGMRYLQHLDFKRMRESIKERNILHQLAPHLVKSQPFLMPIYGHGIKGKETLTLYLKLYDLISPERRHFSDPYRRVPDSRMISKAEVLKIAPGINSAGLNGGAVWYEGQMQNTERLSFSVLRSGYELDALFFNYTEVTKINNSGNNITGLEVKDTLSGNRYKVQARFVLNAAGPWINKILNLCDLNFKNPIHLSKAFSLLTKPISESYAITFPIQPMYTDQKAIVNKNSSLQFAIPWRGKTMYASLHLPCQDTPDEVSITDEEIKFYIDKINEGLPGAHLNRKDIDHILWGIVPAESQGSAAPMKHYKIIDHQEEDGISGMGTIVGVKYVTSRDIAQKAIDMVENKLKKHTTPCRTASTPLWGGDIEYFEDYIHDTTQKYHKLLPKQQVIALIQSYGNKCDEVISLANEFKDMQEITPNSNITKAQVLYAIRNELAEKLSDIVFRRTDLGSRMYPGDAAIKLCAEIMAKEKKWDSQRVNDEIQTVKNEYLITPQ